MKLKKTKKEDRERIKKRAIFLYKQDYTTREIGKLLGKSHSWVALVIKDKFIQKPEKDS